MLAGFGSAVLARQDLGIVVNDISGSISGTSKYSGRVMGSDGLRYLVPGSAENIAIHIKGPHQSFAGGG